MVKIRKPFVIAGLLSCIGLSVQQSQAQAPKAAPGGGTTLVDRLQPEGGEIRTQPRIPAYGAFGLLVGNPSQNAQGVGVQIDKPKQAILYPTVELLTGATGTIQFSAISGDGVPATANRVLLDSWAIAGPSRWLLTAQGDKLNLSYTDDAGAVKTIDAPGAFQEKANQRITVLWDADDVSLLVNGVSKGKIEKPKVTAREPLGIALGNSRDLTSPSGMTISDLRLSTAREPLAPSTLPTTDENLAPDALTIKIAQNYDRRLYPFLERLRQAGVSEVPFFFAQAYADISDIDRALQTITPIAKDPNNPLNVQAVFLRGDLLSAQKMYADAYEQLQVLVGSKDVTTSVRAQVRQASYLYEEGNKSESKRLISDILARYNNLSEINDAYLMIGLDRFRSGDYQGAYLAFRSIGIPGAKPRQTASIGMPIEIKVADADLNVRVADVGMPVTVTTTSGDKEELLLKAAFSRGVYIGSIDSALGAPNAGDKILQVQGDDKVQISYIDRVSEGGQNQMRTVGIDLANNAEIAVIAQSALGVYREVQKYQKLNVIDENWLIVGDLPKNASEFFRDKEDGTILRKGIRLDKSFINSIRPGQSVHVEVLDADEDRGAKPSSIPIEITSRTGKKIPVILQPSGPRSGVYEAVVKTTAEGQPKEGAIEVNANDTLTGRYMDARVASGAPNQPRESRISIRSMAGVVSAGLEVKDPYDPDGMVYLRIARVPGGTPTVTIHVEDRDLDDADTPDKVSVNVRSAGGAEQTISLTETGNHTGFFAGKVRLSADGAGGSLKVKSGEMVTISYIDAENPSGKSETREYEFKANVAEDATVKFFRRIVEQPPVTPGVKYAALPPAKITWEETKVLVPNSVYRVELTDPDVFPTQAGEFFVNIKMKASNGAVVEIPLRAYARQTLPGSKSAGEIYFSDTIFIRLGDSNSPTRAYFSQTGTVVDIDQEKAGGLWSLPSVNLGGKDKVDLIYVEPLAADGKANVTRTIPYRVADDGTIMVLNNKGNPIETMKPGMPFDLQIRDGNGDITAKRDAINATLTSSGGDSYPVTLTENGNHTGTFTALVKTAYGDGAKPNDTLEIPFAGTMTITYKDADTIAGTPADRVSTISTRSLGEASGVLLTKIYEDPKFEVETLVRLGESLYAVGAADLTTEKTRNKSAVTNARLQESARILEQIADRFPTSDYVVEALYLTGKIRREEKNYESAQKLFTRVIEEYPDSEFVPQALYQLVLLHYDRNDIENSTESAMRLVYGFPKNPMVADAFLRIAEYYYNQKQYLTAAFIYKRVIERFPDNPRVELIMYRMATAYYRAGLALDDGTPKGQQEAQKSLASAVRYYLEFSDLFKDHELADDGLYWAAQATLKQGAGDARTVQRAYTLLTKQLITYADGDMKSYATRLRDKIKEENPKIEAEPY